MHFVRRQKFAKMNFPFRIVKITAPYRFDKVMNFFFAVFGFVDLEKVNFHCKSSFMTLEKRGARLPVFFSLVLIILLSHFGNALKNNIKNKTIY